MRLRATTSIVAHLSTSLVDLTVERARDRVRLELVRQARRNMVDKQIGVIELAPTHADLAAQVGSHREEVTRETTYLRQRSLVKKDGRRLLVRVRAVEDLYQRERPGCKWRARVRIFAYTNAEAPGHCRDLQKIEGELTMGLRGYLLAVVGATAVAMQAGANPIDTDNDGVFDDDDDCPSLRATPKCMVVRMSW